LQGGNQLTRNELAALLHKSDLVAAGEFRMGYILMQAELDGVICSGPRGGKQFTYALLDERVSNSKSLGRDKALAELACRYFVTRGPATVHDFAKWSGLKVADAQAGLEAVSTQLQCEVVPALCRRVEHVFRLLHAGQLSAAVDSAGEEGSEGGEEFLDVFSLLRQPDEPLPG
jgi:hypothetical protein